MRIGKPLALVGEGLSRNRIDLFLVAVYLGLPFLFYYNLFSSSGFWGVGDAVYYYVPNRLILAQSLLNHELPLWNPTILSGYPHMADIQSAVFYPLNLLLFGLLPFNQAYNYNLLLHISGAGIFTYLYLKQIGLQRGPAFLGGLVFMFSAPFCLTKSHLTIQNALIWLPAVLWMYEKYLQEQKKAYLIGAAIFFSLQVFAGFPQISLYTLLILGIYGIFSRRRHIKWYQDLCLFIFTVAGLTLIQVLPTWELARYAGRTRISYEIFSSASMSFVNLITLFFPYFFGSYAPYQPVPLYQQLYWGPGYGVDPYIGIIPLMLALYGIYAYGRQSFYVKVWTAVTVFALLFALGGNIPFLAHFFYHIPAIHSFRVPIRILSFFSFGLVVIFSLALNEYVLRADERNTRRALGKFYLIGTLLVSTAVILLTQNDFLLRSWLEHFHKIKPGESIALFQQALALDSPQMMVPFLTFLAGFGVCYFLSRVSSGTVQRYGLYLVLLVILCDLHMVLFYDFSNMYSKLAPSHPGIEIIQSSKKDTDRIYPVITQDLAEWYLMQKLNYGSNVNTCSDLNSLRGYATFSPLEYRAILGMDEYGLGDGDWQALLAHNQILSLLNARFVIVPEKYRMPIEEITAKSSGVPPYEKIYQDQDHAIYENRRVFPKLFTVPEVKPWNKDPVQLFAADLSQTAYLASLDEASIPNRALSGSQAAVEITKYKSGKAEANVSASGETFLVFSESYFPGWKAYVDGRQVKVYQVDGMVQGIFIPTGTHRIKFIYWPDSFLLGLMIHICTLVVLVAFFLVSRGRKGGKNIDPAGKICENRGGS